MMHSNLPYAQRQSCEVATAVRMSSACLRCCEKPSTAHCHCCMIDVILSAQIDRDHLTILNDTRIQDGHHEIWEQEYVAGIVAAEVDVREINTVGNIPQHCAP